jgi:hypothetical protein
MFSKTAGEWVQYDLSCPKENHLSRKKATPTSGRKRLHKQIGIGKGHSGLRHKS